jgi:class 3 adenylate cyclase
MKILAIAMGHRGIAKASLRAFDAAIDIIRITSRICNKFQDELNFGIGGLGAAIGIHTGESIWIAEENQIRAIGDSVIFASRLCSEAEVRSIFISRSQFGMLIADAGQSLYLSLNGERILVRKWRNQRLYTIIPW